MYILNEKDYIRSVLASKKKPEDLSIGYLIVLTAKYYYINNENIEKEHICCAFSDKKCKDSYELKKTWLKNSGF